MRFETFVALRYLVASRRRAHVALIATISVVGLAVGVAALVVSLALLSGFQDRIRRQMMDRSAHLRVSPSRGVKLTDPENVRQVLVSLKGVAAVAPVIEGRGWASDMGGSTAVPVRFRNGPVGPAGTDGPAVRITSAVAARRSDLEIHRVTKAAQPPAVEPPHTFLARVRNFLRLSH